MTHSTVAGFVRICLNSLLLEVQHIRYNLSIGASHFLTNCATRAKLDNEYEATHLLRSMILGYEAVLHD